MDRLPTEVLQLICAYVWRKDLNILQKQGADEISRLRMRIEGDSTP